MNPTVTILKDLISGTVLPIDEWIRKEIYRLQNNIKPRHFQNYSELAEMVHEDPCRFQAYTLPVFELNHIKNTSLPPDSDHKELYNSNERYEDTLQEDDEYDECMDDNEAEEEEYEEEYEEEEDEEDEEEEDDNKDIDDSNTEQNNDTQAGKLEETHPPPWLCQVFIELIRYCDRLLTAKREISITMNAPKLLLDEFEELHQSVKLGRPINVQSFREELLKILFGKIQMTEHLVKVWKLMCEWVTRPSLNCQQSAMRWINLTLSAYIAAQALLKLQ